MTVGQLLANTTSRELAEWRAFFQLEREQRAQLQRQQQLEREAQTKLEARQATKRHRRR